jgi:hypothetical protein
MIFPFGLEAGRGRYYNPFLLYDTARRKEVMLQAIRNLAGAQRGLAKYSTYRLMIGPPGAGKAMLARRLPGALPQPGFEDALEVFGDLHNNAHRIANCFVWTRKETLSFFLLTGLKNDKSGSYI